MGKSSGSAKQDITEYKMSMHIGVALELDSVRKVTVDDKVAWQGNVTDSTTLNINQPYLYGGEKKEGGLSGVLQILMGRANQILTTAAAQRYGGAPNAVPGFRGFTSLFFHGFGYDGFRWKNNSPVIAQKVEVDGTCAPKAPELNQAYRLILNPDFPSAPDANPAHIIYEALTDTEFGMGGSPDSIDAASFDAAAQTLYNEGFGLTILWMRQTTIEDIVNEVLDHIQATLYADPLTGLLTLKLLRDDYGPVEDLFVVSRDNAKLVNYKIRTGGEIVNEITVSWTNPATEKSESITNQDNASIQAQGEKVSGSRDYYGVRYSQLARNLLARDLRSSTAPLVSCEAVINRSAWNKKPGDVVLLDWPERNIYGLVMRVGKVNYGSPKSSTVRVPLLQDVFSLSRPPITVDPGTGWVDPSADPQPLTMQVGTLPFFFTLNGLIQKNPVPLVEPEVLAMVLADSQDKDSLDYELVSATADPAGNIDLASMGTKTMTPLSYLTAMLPAQAESEIPFALFPDPDETPQVGGFIWIGHGDLDQEIALVTAVTSTGWTIARGVLDTTPRQWPVATPLWAVNVGANVVDTQTLRSAGESVTYKGLDRTSKGTLSSLDAPNETATLTDRPYLPLRPANVKISGTAFGTLNLSGDTEFTITWAIRNRQMEDSQVLRWTDGSVAPEYRQETVIIAYDAVSGDEIAEYPYMWTETSRTFQKTDFDRYSAVRFEVRSRIDGADSLTGHSITVTGFANNPGADAPPGPGDRDNPPSVINPPALSAFTAVASDTEVVGGTRLPVITVSGTQDNLDAQALVFRYRINASGDDWSKHPAVALDKEYIQFNVSEIDPDTTYNVGVAYVIDGITSEFRSLPNVATGSVYMGGVIADELGARLTSVEGLAASNAAAVADLEEVYGDTVSAAASALAADASADNAYLSAIQAQGHADDADAAASAAVVQAGIATTKATEAGISANAASASQVSASLAAAKAVRAAGNFDFDLGKDDWIEVDAWTWYANSGGWSGVIESAAGASGNIVGPSVTVPAGAEPRLELSIRFRGYFAPQGYYIGFLMFDGSGVLVGGSDGTGNYPLGAALSVEDAIIERRVVIGRGGTIAASPYGGTVTIPSNVATIRPTLYYNYANEAGRQTRLDYFRVDDVTQREAAGKSASAAATSASNALVSETAAGVSASAASGSATNAATSAGNASTFASQSASARDDAISARNEAGTYAGYAASDAGTAAGHAATATAQASSASASALSASNSALVAVGAGQGYRNKNPYFSAWSNPSNPPDGWLWWGSAGLRDTIDAAAASPYAVRFPATGGSGAGLQYPTVVNGQKKGRYVVSLEVTLNAVNLNGVGFLFRPLNSSGAVISYEHECQIQSLPNADGSGLVGLGTVGRTYRVDYLADCTSDAGTYDDMQGVSFYVIMDGYFNGTNKDVSIRMAGWRLATAEEVRANKVLAPLGASVAQQASAMLDLKNNYALARYTVSAVTPGGAAVLSLVSSSYGTVAGLSADQIYFGENTYFDNATDTLRTTSGSNTRVLALGASFGTDGQLTEWEGPSSTPFSSMSRANAYYYRANVAPYVGGNALPSGGGDAGSRRLVTSTDDLSSATFVDWVSVNLTGLTAGMKAIVNVAFPQWITASNNVGGTYRLYEQNGAGRNYIGAEKVFRYFPVFDQYGDISDQLFDIPQLTGTLTKSGAVTLGVQWKVAGSAFVDTTAEVDFSVVPG